jgi:PD-(D/E)XK nuclease superfamily
MASDSETLSLPEVHLPDKLTISNSLAKEWKTCRRKFFFNYLALLTPKKTSIPFFVGRYYHKGMEAFYKNEDPDDFIPTIIKDMDKKANEAVFLTPEESDKLMIQSAIVEGMLRGYVSHFAKDNKRWKVIAAEKEFSVPITDDIAYVGQIDLIVKFEGDLFIVEHKTAGRLDKNYVDRLALDTQITGYMIGAKHLLKEPIKGVFYNAAKKPQIRQKKDETKVDFANRIVGDYNERPDFYFFRESLYRDMGAVKEYKAEISELAADIKEHIEHVRKVGPEKGIFRFYRTTEACTSRGPCPYLNICTKGWNRDIAQMYQVRESLNPELASEKEESDGGDE